MGSILMEAASKGFIDIVKMCIDRGADVNCKTINGNNAILLTAKADILRLLLRAGAELNCRNDDRDTPLTLAAYFGALGRNIFIFYYAKGRFEIVKELIAQNADLEIRGDQGLTALQWAVKKGRKECAELLRAAGAKESGNEDQKE